jgi:AcrR family transcriptional regulator
MDLIQERIVKAATQEFLTAGYDECSMSRIAKAAGSTKPTVYRLYGSKEGLFKTVMEQAIQQSLSDARDFHKDERPAEVVLREVAERIRCAGTRSDIARLWQIIAAAREKFPELYKDVRELVSQASIAKRLELYFSELNKRGVMNIRNPLLAANNFALLAGPAADMLNMTHAGFTDEERTEEILHIFMRAYAK